MSATANIHDEHSTQVVMVHDGYNEQIDNTLQSRTNGALKLSANGMFTTSNPELAAEMMETYRGHVDVAPWRTAEKPNGRVMFTMPEMPWKKKKELENVNTENPTQS